MDELTNLNLWELAFGYGARVDEKISDEEAMRLGESPITEDELRRVLKIVFDLGVDLKKDQIKDALKYII